MVLQKYDKTKDVSNREDFGKVVMKKTFILLKIVEISRIRNKKKREIGYYVTDGSY